MKYLVIIFGLLVAVTLFEPARGSAESGPDTVVLQAEEIAGEVMSPFCPGKLLKDCPSGQAAELRNKIRDRIAGGEKEEDVLESIYALYGEEIRAAPKKSGFGLVAWVAPFVFLGVGLALLYAWLKRKVVVATNDRPVALDPKVQARVDLELNNS